jgi:hypothetical protein
VDSRVLNTDFAKNIRKNVWNNVNFSVDLKSFHDSIGRMAQCSAGVISSGLATDLRTILIAQYVMAIVSLDAALAEPSDQLLMDAVTSVMLIMCIGSWVDVDSMTNGPVADRFNSFSIPIKASSQEISEHDSFLLEEKYSVY